MPRDACRRCDAGFTLIEVSIALGLIAIALVGVVQIFVIAIRATDAARVQTTTTVLAAQKVEQLRALTWTTDANGVPVSDTRTNLAVDPPDRSGAGLSASPASTLDSNTAGFVDFLSSQSEWVGTGATPPASARYIRRWRIQPLPEDPANLLAVQVLVTTVERDRQAATGANRTRLAGDALTTTVMARR
jgi:prepilin-type N-terminal cleavage/methylation domain-containing protein